MLVVGIDPGTATTGYGVVISEAGAATRRQAAAVPLRLVECGVIRTRPRDPLSSRLVEIAAGVRELIARHHPDLMAVEDAFYSRNAQTTLTLGHARGVVLLTAAEAGVPIVEFPPAEIKKTVVGTGSASKEQVQYMLTQLLHLRSSPQPADASDGVAAAVTAILTAHVRRLRAGATPPTSARRAAAGGAKVIEFPTPQSRGRLR
jgi:crossover junction endodeoxyribonuclease RuvC